MKNHSERAHALLSASASKRWLNCTPSAVLEDQVEQEESVYAAEGTLAHELAELMLNRDTKRITQEQYKKDLRAIKLNELYKLEMGRHVETFTTYVLEQYAEAQHTSKSAELLIESKIDLSTYVPEGFGTIDDIIIGDHMLEVIDLKYGAGVKVNAEDNPQLKLYGLGALVAHEFAYDIQTVRLTIVQPRLNHFSSWDIPAEALRAWGEKVVKPIAKIAFEGKGDQVVGDWCKFCKVKAQCKALADYSLEVAKDEFREPKLLTDLQLLEAYNKADIVIAWLSAVKKHVFNQAYAKGKKWTGYKLVHGKSSRRWKDDDLVIDALLAEGYTEDKVVKRSVKGIGDISSLMSVDDFNRILGELIIKPPGKPTLAPESDGRPEYYAKTAKDDFAD